MAENDENTAPQDSGGTPGAPSEMQRTVTQIWETVIEGSELPEKTLKVQLPVGSEQETVTASPTTEAEKAGAEKLSDDYEILDVIGEGGIGIVYTAHQISLDREVALKVLKDSSPSRRSIIETAFTSEAIVTGDLDHPNIVPIHAIGRGQEGKIFYTMKKVRGQAWKERLDQMTLDENLEVLLRVCDAVAFAHSRGVMHRDLKPQNVMLGGYGEVLVVDWGLAASVHPTSKVQKHGGTVGFGGTPAYMAPEMALARQRLIGTHSDVYLLGGLLYRIVTGVTPHTGAGALSCISAAAENRIQPTDKKGELIDIALKAMSAPPSERHESVEAFQEAIRHYRAHAESIVLAEDAYTLLAQAQKARDYDVFSRSIYGFDAALSLWRGNQEAQQGREEARLAYAECAYESEDYDLALSLLDADKIEHQVLREIVLAAKAERDRSKKAIRRLKHGALTLAGLLLGSLAVGFFWIRAERDTALREGYATSIGLAAKKIDDSRFDKAQELLDGCPRWLRHWEWGRLKYLCRRSLLTFGRHSSQVEAVAFSPDGKRVASGSWSGTIRIWEADTGRELSVIGAHKDTVCCLAYSPDGRTLASASDDNTAGLWDAATGRQIAALEGHSGQVWAIAFSPDGQTVASGGEDGTVRQWSVETGAEVATFKGGWGAVTSVAFSADGRYLAWGTGELEKAGSVHLYDRDAMINVGALLGHTDRVNCVALSADGNLIASGAWDDTIRLWDTASRRTLAVLGGHDGPVYAVAFSPDDAWLASGSDDATIKRWDARTGREVGTFRGHSGAVGGIAISPDGQRIVSGSTDETVKLWDAERSSIATLALKGHADFISSVTFSPDGTRLASGSNDGTIRLWDPRTDREATILAQHTHNISSVAFSPDGKRMASGSGDNTVRVWDVETGECTATLLGHSDLPRQVQFSPDGTQVASASFDGTIKLWDVQSKQEISTLKGHTAPVQSVAFSPDGKRLASAARDTTVRLWDISTGQNTAILEGHAHWVRCVAFSPDGRLIASAGDDNVVKLWDAGKGIEVADLKGHVKWVKSLAFSPDGRRLVSGGDDAVIRVWDVRSGRELLALQGESFWIWSVAFSPDGRRIASGGGDATVRVWETLDWAE